MRPSEFSYLLQKTFDNTVREPRLWCPGVAPGGDQPPPRAAEAVVAEAAHAVVAVPRDPADLQPHVTTQHRVLGNPSKKMWKIPHLGGGPDPGIFDI